MHIDTDQLDSEYPPRPECDVNQKDCKFDPVEFTCHECGKKLCRSCAVGVRHQPQLIKYNRIRQEENEQVQMHCPGCADTHDFNLQKVAAGAGGVLLGILIFAVLNGSGAILAVGAVSLLIGAGLLYHEYKLKKKLQSEDIFEQQAQQRAKRQG